MIYFITNQLNDEPCILQEVKTQELRITTLDGEEILTVKCSGAWTHEKIISIDLSPFEEKIRQGADAYIGDKWIGSTEC